MRAKQPVTPDAVRTIRRGVIDVGTNSVRLLVADVHKDGRIVPVLHLLELPRLGEGVDEAKRLTPAAMARTCAAVGRMHGEAKAAGVPSPVVVGTSALRDAINRADFIEDVERRFGLDVVVLSGEEEAALSFAGAAAGWRDGPGSGEGLAENGDACSEGGARSLTDKSLLFVVDVGGGSTELTYGSPSGEMHGRMSVDAGSVRMTEMCIRSDPVSDDDRRRLEEAVARTLAPLEPIAERARQGVPSTLLAVAGTATTLAAMDLGLVQYDGDRVHGHRISKARLAELLDELSRKTAAERRALAGLSPERADIIVAGTFILHHVVERLGADGFVASEADLLFGVLRADEIG